MHTTNTSFETTQKDIVQHYMVTKILPKELTKKQVAKMINTIINYIQTTEIYFKAMPRFYKGVLLFSVVGFKKDHARLLKKLGGRLNKLNCKCEKIGKSKI